MKKVLLVAGERMGGGDDALGTILMEKFFMTLSDRETLPAAILFYNTGVRLCSVGSPVEPYLQALAQRGVALRACGTCTAHLKVETTEAVEAGTMAGFVDTILSDATILTL